MLRLRILAIAAGYENADDCDASREDPACKMAVGGLPETGLPRCSQPRMSTFENALSARALARMMAAMVDLFCDSGVKVPTHIVLDIDDTWDEAHGDQQLSPFNAHYDGYGFLPIHIYEAGSGKPVAAILSPGKTPAGVELRTILKHVIRRIPRNWPRVANLVRSDSHYARPQGGSYGGHPRHPQGCLQKIPYTIPLESLAGIGDGPSVSPPAIAAAWC